MVTLLDIVRSRYGITIDPDSDGGQILNSLTPDANFGNNDLSGKADVAPLTFTPASGGVSVRAAQANDALVFSLPAGPLDFTIIPPGAGGNAVVEISILEPTVPVPFLKPASLSNDLLHEIPGKVVLDFPDLLLVVTASAGAPAIAKLAPSHNAVGALEVAMVPPFALIGPGAVLGFGFEDCALNLDGPGEPEITVPVLEIYVAPEGIPPLAMHGGGRDLKLGLGAGNGGLSGEFLLSLASGAVASKRPRFLRNMATRLRLKRNVVTLLELTGQVDLGAEVQAQIGAPLPDAPGIIDYRLQLVLDQGWQASLSLRSGDAGFLWRTKRSGSGQDLPRDTLGAYAVFSPLLVSTLPMPGGSGYVDLALGAGAAGGLAASQWVSTQSLTLVGGELVVRKPNTGAAEAFLFFALETELNLDVHVGGTKIISTRKPLKVNQKAIGIRLDFGTGGVPKIEPVFDPAQGFSLDLSDPGTFEIPGVLGDILQPDRARMAKENPLNFEVDFITKADLGVVTIDRASVRVPLTGSGGATLRGLGARLNAGPVQGGGYLTISKTGFKGSLDASIAPPLGIRASATLELGKAEDPNTQEKMTSVLASFSVEWPVPVPLANSGLGLYGFLGLFGMHIERDEHRDGALQWLVDANGDPAKGKWRGAAHRWAIGLGAVIGTVEGGFLIHAKGMLMLELPGPRILVLMKADILSARPPKEGPDTGSLLAIIDIRPESLTIGVVAEYKIPFLLEVRVPAEAFFDFVKAENWYLDIGKIPPKLAASVRFMSSLRAEGYLMIHGGGIDDFPLRKLPGFAVAAGIRAALTWGPEEIGLYIRVAAQADVAISFKPAFIIGKMTLEGELHIFIVSIGASASAEVFISPDRFSVRAQVCGEVDFFFFSVKGCVTLKLGDDSLPPPVPEPLIRALSLHSRSPALLSGSGTDRSVDGSLGTAFHFEDGNFVGDGPNAVMPVVPIDAIPVLEFEMRPQTDAACTFFGQSVPSLLSDTGWIRRGERFYRYTLKSIDLTALAENGTPLPSPLSGVETPVVWWDRYGKPAPGDDNDVQLALLSWIPDPTPAAAERTVSRDKQIKNRWGDVCAQTAPPAPVLWTFTGRAAGPSSSGWTLQGMIWPDPPGTVRSTPPGDLLKVTEPWRSGDPLADALVQVVPAFVCTSNTISERLLVAPRTGGELQPRIEDDTRFDELINTFAIERLKALPDALRFNTKGTRRIRALVFLIPEVGKLVLRGIDQQGRPDGFETAIDNLNSRFVFGINDLPGEWRSPASPWFSTVKRVVDAWFQAYVGPLSEPPLIFLEVELPDDTAEVELGLDQDRQTNFPKWGVLIVEALSEAEFGRYKFDETQRKTKETVVNGALGADQSKRALLMPGAIYNVVLNYDVVATKADDKGNPAANGVTAPTSHSQQFRFKTDKAPPERLEPWVMATAPSEGEAALFYTDPLRVVFSTNATRKLFKAYNCDLFARVWAASGKHPPERDLFDPAMVQLENTTAPIQALGAIAKTPFEGALYDALDDQPCIDRTHTLNRHELVTLTMKLEPSTEYILDLQAQRPDGSLANPQSAYPMFRRNFTTSRYPDVQAFAADVVLSPIAHRYLANPAPLAVLGSQTPGRIVRDSDLEKALRDARWGDLGQVTKPRVTVIWQGSVGAPAQPFALLLETPESAWRMRGVPEVVPSSDGVKRYELVEKPWLDIIENIVGAANVSFFLRTTGGMRTLAILGAGARGRTLQLSLRRTPHPFFEGGGAATTALLATVNLTNAPWEDLS